MKNPLDAEPPSKFAREKEVSKKKNITLNQLVLSMKNEKSKNNNPLPKNIEKHVKLKLQDYISDENYIRTDNNSIEEISSTVKSFSFTGTLDMNLNNLNSDFAYSHKSTTEIEKNKPSNFYEMSSSYSFIPQIKEEDKKENYFLQEKEQEAKEVLYNLYNFDEEPQKEE